MHLTHRTTCRVCGSAELTKVIDLGNQFLQGSFVKPGESMPPKRKIPMVLLRCDPTRDENACGLLQMQHSVPTEILYSSYWYRSGTNNTMRTHLAGIAAEAEALIQKPNAKVLDIGCNDGSLLKNYPASFKKYGVDPSDIVEELFDLGNEWNIVKDIFPSKELINNLQDSKLDIITSIAMFYDLEDPIGFTKGIKNILAPEGVWIFEMSYMPMMLKMNSYDTICHEHLEYYSLAVIEYILKKADMKIFNVIESNINGGSIRCFATHVDNFKYKDETFVHQLQQKRQEEFEMELDTDKPYKNFQDRINLHREQMINLLKELKKNGKKIHVYGASTKGNTILQWCGFDNHIIECAAERNPDKYGAFTLGTDIPIVSEADSRALKPDYYLMLPWHFKEEFIEREKAILNEGTCFIFPLPSLQIVTKQEELETCS
jgi:2-polyprenyl-3-methyl-5-hydroxy-6-metoxy-1,4-benzoquinol methylase